jgi:hypothetical protein
MKTRFQVLLAGALALILAGGSLSARADQTNDAPPPPPKAEHKVFFFEGGRPIDLILAIDRHFRTRIQQILSIPSSLTRASVPKMKVVAEKPTDPLWVYNNLQDPALGQWKWEGPATDPSVMALVPDKDAPAFKKSGALVRAFSIGGLPKDSWGSVESDIAAAGDVAAKVTPETAEEYKGTIHIQPESKVLIAGGTDTYVNMVESVIAAHLANLHAEVTKAPEPK